MFCRSCATKLYRDAKFCEACGYVSFDRADFRRWKRFINRTRRFGKLPTRVVSNTNLWNQFVREFLIRGGTRLIEQLDGKGSAKKEFLNKTSLHALSNPALRRELGRTLAPATRFPSKAAANINRCRASTEVVRNGRFVLLANLRRTRSEIELRKQILERCPDLGWKGASDFLISTGRARDLVAIDTRILRCLQQHFATGRKISKARACPDLYLSVESALREVARRNHICAAQLDRIIFRTSGKSLLDFFLEGTPDGAANP